MNDMNGGCNDGHQIPDGDSPVIDWNEWPTMDDIKKDSSNAPPDSTIAFIEFIIQWVASFLKYSNESTDVEERCRVAAMYQCACNKLKEMRDAHIREGRMDEAKGMNTLVLMTQAVLCMLESTGGKSDMATWTEGT